MTKDVMRQALALAKQQLDNYKTVGIHKEQMTMPKFESVAQNHILYKTYDTDAPEAIKDRNGYVALGLCKICGKGEAELDGPCVPLYTADQLTEAYEAGKRDVIPEGWVLVPKVPTEEMLIAGMETPCTASDEDWRDDYVDVYKSMLAAAPKGEE